MPKYIKIPIIKNKGLEVKKKSASRRMEFYVFLGVCAGLFLMLSFVWLRIETNDAVAQLRLQKQKLSRIKTENQKLHSEVDRLASMAHIQPKAEQRFGLLVLPRGRVVHVSH